MNSLLDSWISKNNDKPMNDEKEYITLCSRNIVAKNKIEHLNPCKEVVVLMFFFFYITKDALDRVYDIIVCLFRLKEAPS